MAQPSKDAQDKIQQLQLLEHNLNNFTLQKQSFQLQMQEIESALKEIEKVDTAYKIIGGIMVSAPKEKLKEIFKILDSDGDLSLNVDKAMQVLDDINEDINLKSYTRSQVWNLVSILEKNRLRP